MTEPNLKDPRKLFYSDGFPQQEWSLNQIVGKTAMSEITN